MNKEAKTNIFMYNLARVMSLVVCLLTLSFKYSVNSIGKLLVTCTCLIWGVACASEVLEDHK